MSITYKDLFVQVVEQIQKYSAYPSTNEWKQQTNKSEVSAPVFFSSPSSTVDTGELSTTLSDLLSELNPSQIKSGLTIEATVPTTNKITVKAGEGIVGGKIIKLNKDVTIQVPFDNSTEVFYVTLFTDGVKIETSTPSDSVILGKILVPKPGTTEIVKDNAEDDDVWDAYIINLKEYKLHGDAYGKLEEDSIELLRDNIGDILAETIIGTLTLNENLKITNTAGTLELNSDSLELKDSDGNLLTKLNNRGTFYYNTDGVEIAKFAVDEARIGNILLTTNSIQSANFLSGYNGKGFQIQDDGNAQFLNVQVRGELHSAVFTKDEVQVSGGDLLVTNGTILNEDITSTTTTFQIKEAVFTAGDILSFKNEQQQEYLKVTALGGEGSIPTITVTRNYQGGGTARAWVKGDVLAQMGSRIAIVTSGDTETNVPYIDMVERTSNDDPTCESTRLRLGNLCGVTDSDMGGQLNNYGLYADNVYLKGCLFAPTISTAASGSRVEMNSECFYTYDDSSGLGNPVFKLCFGATNPGDVVIGDENADFMKWDNGASCLRFESCGTSRCVEIGDGLIVANELCLVDVNCVCCYSYLSAGQWFFHDILGNNVPYIRRVCTDSATTGATICLCGWTSVPNILVAIKELGSYDSGFSASCQNWCVWSTTPVFYDDSPSGEVLTDFGYCFDVHACLVKTSGTFAECIQDVAFGTCVVTNAAVDCTIVRGQFQLWKTDTCASNCYCYGVICWRVCYKCCTGGCAWCSCEWSFEQAHSTEGELKSNQNDCHTITYTGTGCYILCAEAVGATTWTCSLLPQGIACCCCRAVTGAASQSSGAYSDFCFRYGSGCAISCSWTGNASNNATFGGSNPSNVYCAYICYCWVGAAYACESCYNPGAHCWLRNHTGTGKVCIFGCTFDSDTTVNISCCNGTNWSTSPTMAATGACKDMTACAACTFTNMQVCAYYYMCVCLGGDPEAAEEYAGLRQCTRGGTYTICSGTYLVQCWCSFDSGVTCEYTRLYGTKDTTDAQTVLDPDGVISYLAVAAS